jgi:hypothetical protein
VEDIVEDIVEATLVAMLAAVATVGTAATSEYGVGAKIAPLAMRAIERERLCRHGRDVKRQRKSRRPALSPLLVLQCTMPFSGLVKTQLTSQRNVFVESHRSTYEPSNIFDQEGYPSYGVCLILAATTQWE